VDEVIRAKNEKEKLDKEHVAKMEPVEFVDDEPVGHTGQKFAMSDYRRGRFDYVAKKQVDENFPIDLSKEQPIVVSHTNIVWSGGGAVGFPKVYLNLDRNKVHTCGYSGRRFILKKYYDPAKHGKSITYEQYLEEMAQYEDDII
jgi:NADH dehydrogenase (ubiquinone) Fe-S protein 6